MSSLAQTWSFLQRLSYQYSRLSDYLLVPDRSPFVMSNYQPVGFGFLEVDPPQWLVFAPKRDTADLISNIDHPI